MGRDHWFENGFQGSESCIPALSVPEKAVGAVPGQMLCCRPVPGIGGERDPAAAHAGEAAIFGEFEEAEEEQRLVRRRAAGAVDFEVGEFVEEVRRDLIRNVGAIIRY